MSWANAVLSTLTTITRHESEIRDLIAGAANDYLADGVSIDSDTVPLPGMSSQFVGSAQGVLEIDIVAASEITIAVGEELTIRMYDSIDDSSFDEIHSGAIVYSRTASGAGITIATGTTLAKWVVPPDADDYIKPVITSSADNSGTLDIYTISKWEDKISVAKEYIGNRLEIVLNDRGVEVDEADGDVLLDVVANPTVFSLASDYYTLALIYRDLNRSQDESYYTQKSDEYRKSFYAEFNDALKRMNMDYDADGETDERRVNIETRFRS